jgi:predicted acetyltransferase
MGLARRVFGGAPPTDEDIAAVRERLEFDRTLAFFDEKQIVSSAAIFSFEITVPGGDAVRCGGVTRVGVLSTHRRQGLLRAMMRRQLDDMHERGEPLAVLLASEAPIYGRFGYGLAAYHADLEIDRERASSWRPTSGGRVSLVDLSTAVEAFSTVQEKARRQQPGMFRLDQRWWRFRLADPAPNRKGLSPLYRAIYEDADGASGLALYRVKLDWDAGGPIGVLHLEELTAATDEGYAALWRYVLDVDMMIKVNAPMRSVEEPLRFMLPDPRQPRTTVVDGLWLRLVDVEHALPRRKYTSEGRLVIAIRDEFCPWNSGSYELDAGPSGGSCRRSTRPAELELSAADLGALYLGGNRAEMLQRAGRLVEHRRGAVELIDRMFAAERAPWCPTHF